MDFRKPKWWTVFLLCYHSLHHCFISVPVHDGFWENWLQGRMGKKKRAADSEPWRWLVNCSEKEKIWRWRLLTFFWWRRKETKALACWRGQLLTFFWWRRKETKALTWWRGQFVGRNYDDRQFVGNKWTKYKEGKIEQTIKKDKEGTRQEGQNRQIITIERR